METLGSSRSARCPACAGSWPAAIETCPQDGSLLVPLGDGGALELEPGTRLGDYVITGRLGQGGMSTVHAAIHPLIGKRVAIKVMAADLCCRREAVLRFVQEARAVSQLGHPNIVDVFTFGTLPDGRCYFVMELLLGETLAQRLRDGALAFADKIEIGVQMCDALEAVHARGFVHRDLKPANVFLTVAGDDRPRVKLLDFGIAKLVARDAVAPSLTSGDVTLGTPEYVSPEQARGKPVSGPSDVYALGVVLYEMFAGELPFCADNTTDLLVKHVSCAPPPPSASWAGIPDALERLLLAMLDKQADRRPHLAEVRASLETVLAEVSRRIEPQPQPLTEPRKRRLARGAMMALLALAPLVGFDGHDDATPPPPVRAELAPPPALAPPPPVQVLADREVAPSIFADPVPAPRATVEKRRRGRARARIDETFLVDPFAAANTARAR